MKAAHRAPLVALLGLTFLCLHEPGVRAQTVPVVFANNLPATLCIRVIGERYSGKVEEAAWGTAFFLNSNVEAITNNHLIPDANKYKSMRIIGKFREKNDKAPDKEFGLTLVDRDVERDLAVLRAEGPIPSRYVYAGNSHAIAPGEELVIIGCPIGLGQSPSRGILNNTVDEPNGRWITDATMNPGNSGGPVFTIGGRAVGIATGSIRNEEGKVPLVGINLVVPLHMAVDTILKTNKIKYVDPDAPANSQVFATLSSPVAAVATFPASIVGRDVAASSSRPVNVDVKANAPPPRRSPSSVGPTVAAASDRWKEIARADPPRPLPASG